MEGFDFVLRTRLVFGEGVFARLGELGRELGFRRTLLVADRGLVEAGYVEAAVKSLEGAGVGCSSLPRFRLGPRQRDGGARRGLPPGSGDRLAGGPGGVAARWTAKGIDFVLTNGGTMADYRGYGKAARPLLPIPD